ncbi:MAG: glycoside hydrolase [Actinobacteria bacterium]|nr:glycoside hydrolase [Actinomycetota bacterium]
MSAPELFPRPRRIDRFDDGPRVTRDTTRRIIHDATLPPQGFVLHIDEEEIRLVHADPAGRRYGEATLAQLERPDGTYPAVDIHDSPDFATRGYMLDISRDRVPTNDALDHLVARLAACRYNQLQLYIEHTFANPDHRTVWADASPITPEELTRLDEVCATAGIELVVNQNTFGHFGRWLGHPDYRDRAECPEGFEIVPGFRLPPTVLAPTPQNAAFALDLVRAQTDCVASRTVNIGCDEPFELGKGSSADLVATSGLGSVYVDHLRRLIGPLLDDGFAVQVWGDVIRNHPETLGQLPDAGTTALVWNYDAPTTPRAHIPESIAGVLATIGVDPSEARDFTTILEPFAASGRDFWVAPGTATWQSFVGRLPTAEGNLADAAVAGRRAGASGYLVTDWGDTGHHQPPAISLVPIAYGGAVSWCAESNLDLDAAAAVNTHLVDDRAHLFGGILERIGSVAGATGIVTENASPLFFAVVASLLDLSSGEPDADAVRAVIATLQGARDDLNRATPGCADGAALVAGTDVAIGLATHGARRLLARAEGKRRDPDEAGAELTALIDAYRETWPATSRPGGLDDSAAHLESRLASYRTGG